MEECINELRFLINLLDDVKAVVCKTQHSIFLDKDNTEIKLKIRSLHQDIINEIDRVIVETRTKDI